MPPALWRHAHMHRVEEEPVVSLLRGCSAPVALTVRGRRDAELALLAAAGASRGSLTVGRLCCCCCCSPVCPRLAASARLTRLT